ncbi:hypothetical protein PV04_00938 [Phialophora macrospora]|uniref:Uncharacterized protein n=1 Tax=Phialophora macrospora TaxID=1851006 RepID=A0A0D2FWB3_9EURO|nr:hypothetical protein PV04_00938 [Phialophora macrospora]
MVNLALFMVSNKVAGSQRGIGVEVYHWVKGQGNSELFEYLLSLQDPTAEALTEHLFSISIENKDVHIVRRILDSGLDPNELKCSDRWGTQITPLQRACQLGSPELVRALLDAKADVNVVPPGSYPPLILALESICQAREAADYGSEPEDYDNEPEDYDNEPEDSQAIKLVRILLRAGANLNPDGYQSPLAIAASYAHLELVTFLLRKGADPNFPLGDRSDAPLVLAMCSERPLSDVVSTVRTLVQAGADVNFSFIDGDDDDRKDMTVLDFACEQRVTEVVKVLLEGGARTTEQALINAILRRDSHCVNLLIRYHAPVTERTLGFAVTWGADTICRLLLSSAEESVKGRCRMTMFTKAIESGNRRLMEELSASGIELQSTVELTEAIEAAAERGDIAIFRLLLNEDSRYRDTVLRSLGDSLYLTIAHKRRYVTEILLAAGADVNGSKNGRARFVAYDAFVKGASDTGRTPLHAAMYLMDTALSQRLLTSGAAVNVLSSEGHTYSVLPLAVAWGQHQLIKILLDKGAETDACSEVSMSSSNDDRKSAVTVAAEKNDLKSIQLLVEAGADVNAPFGGITALAAAVQNGNTEIINYLVDHGAKPDQKCLNIAIKNSTNDDLVEHILAIGPDVTEEDLLAAADRYPARMRMILNAKKKRYGRYPRAFGSQTLQHAIASSSTSMVQLLLEYGINSATIVRKYSTSERIPHAGLRWNESAFGTAIRLDMTEDLSLVRRLLKADADPNKIVSEEPTHTALLAAIARNSTKLVDMLVSAGANVNPRLVHGISRTPLQLAVEQGSMDIVNVLLEKGAEVNAPAYDQYGATALQFAAIKGFLGAASTLLEKHADVNAPAAKVGGRTALEGASEHGRIDMIQLLLNAGARVFGEGSRQFERARDLASENGHRAARRLLENYRAQPPSLPGNPRLSTMGNDNGEGDLSLADLTYHELSMDIDNGGGDLSLTDLPYPDLSMDNGNGGGDLNLADLPYLELSMDIENGEGDLSWADLPYLEFPMDNGNGDGDLILADTTIFGADWLDGTL